MSTKAIRELLSDYLSACARANDFSGRAREPDEIERETYRSALAEVDAIEKAAKVLAASWSGRFPTNEAVASAAQTFSAIAKEAK